MRCINAIQNKSHLGTKLLRKLKTCMSKRGKIFVCYGYLEAKVLVNFRNTFWKLPRKLAGYI